MDKQEKEVVLSSIIMIAALVKKMKKGKKNKKQLKKRNASLWSQNWLLRRDHNRGLASMAINELLQEDEKAFRNFARMSKETYEELLGKVAPIIVKKDTVMREAISVHARLLLTLRFLATGERFKQLSFAFRVSTAAISIIVPETLNAIYEVLKDEFLKTPQSADDWRKIATEFQQRWNFPNCLGAIDGKHIAIRYRKEYGSYYYNYKGFHSVILLAVVDANYKFIYVNVGTNGRANDAAAFNSSSLFDGINNGTFNFPDEAALPATNQYVPFVFVADDAFRLNTRILKPHGQRTTNFNKVFNYRLSRARRVVENAFGILANKFQLFQRDIDLSVDKIEDITLAACALHNFVRTRDGVDSVLLDTENTTTVTMIEGSWRKEMYITPLQRVIGNRSGEDGRKLRDIYTEYFNNEGSVPWQLDAIKKFNF